MGDPEPFQSSDHYAQFKDRVDAYRKAGGGEDLLWRAIDDVGIQVSEVRHNLVNTEQRVVSIDEKLFGYRDERDPELLSGGMLGILTRQVDSVNETIKTQTGDQTAEIKANQRWILRLMMGFGSVITVVIGAVASHIIGLWK